jgi:hypothetical protein
MRSSAIWIWVERTANVGIVLAACAIMFKLLQPPAARPATPIVEVGDSLAIDDLSAPLSTRRVLVAFRAGCEFCISSLPFYEELNNSLARGSLVFLTPPHEEEATRRVLSAAGMGSAELVPADFLRNGLHATPLILLVDERLGVEAVWRGSLSSSAQNEVRTAIERKRMTRKGHAHDKEG